MIEPGGHLKEGHRRDVEEKVVTDLDVREGHWTTQTAHDMGGQGMCRAREHAEEILT